MRKRHEKGQQAAAAAAGGCRGSAQCLCATRTIQYQSSVLILESHNSSGNDERNRGKIGASYRVQKIPEIRKIGKAMKLRAYLWLMLQNRILLIVCYF